MNEEKALRKEAGKLDTEAHILAHSAKMLRARANRMEREFWEQMVG